MEKNLGYVWVLSWEVKTEISAAQGLLAPLSV